MVAVPCPSVGTNCEYVTPDQDAAIVAVHLKFHLETMHPTPPPAQVNPVPPTPGGAGPKLQIDRPRISAGATTQEWDHFVRDWNNYKTLCKVVGGQVNTVLVECCEESLKHLMFGQYDATQQASATEADLLAAIKQLAVEHESVLSHRLRLHEAMQTPGQTIHAFLAVLRRLARQCNFKVKCSCDLSADYSDSAVKDQLIKGMSSEEDRQRLLSEPNSEGLSLDEVVSLLHRFELSHRPIQGASKASSASTNTANPCWRCGKSGHDSSKKSREKLCPAYKVVCDKCQSMGHFKKCCPKCADCDSWGHRGKMFRGCPNHEKKEKDKKEKDENATMLQLCKISAEPGFVTNESLRLCSTGDCLCSTEGSAHKQVKNYNFIPIPNFTFDGAQWIQKNNEPHDRVKVCVSVGVEDHRQFRHPVSKPSNLRSTSVSAVADSGAMAITMPPKLAYELGLRRHDFIPCKTRMQGAGGTDLGTIGAVVVCLEATTKDGKTARSKQLAYVCQKVDSFYLSKTAMRDLGIVPKKLIPTVAACNPEKENEDLCECPRRGDLPPPCPDNLPEGIKECEEDIPKLKDWLVNRFASTTFNTCEHQPLPMMTGEPLRIYVDPAAKPVAIHNPASVPLHWKDQVKLDLDRDVRIGVLEKVPVNTPAIWCSRMVVTGKSNGSPRRTVDLQKLNESSLRQTYPVESPFVLASRIPSNKLMSVNDQWNGYHSIPLHKDDRDFTCFATPWGRYRYKVAPQGYLASGDGYNQRYDAILADILNKERCVDDTCTYSDTMLDAFKDVYKLLLTCAENGVILNPEKFQFCQREVEFAGLTINQDTIKPSQKLIRSIMDFPTPKTISDARGWFGLVEQGSWAFSRAQVMGPFRHLLRPKNKFHWNDSLTHLFQLSKKEIVRQITYGVKHFSLDKPTCLATDYSGIGIGFFLMQKNCSCTGTTPRCCKTGWQLTLVGSRFLHDAETRYSPVEGECLAVVYGLHQTRFYTLGCPNLVVATDHKPLLGILNGRSLADIPNRRLMNLKEKTLGFKFLIVHVPGRQHLGADAASRYPGSQAELLKLPGEPTLAAMDSGDNNLYDGMSTTELRHIVTNGLCSFDRVVPDEDVEEVECCVMGDGLEAIKSVPFTTWDTIRLETASDPVMRQLHDTVIEGFPDDTRQLPAHLRPFARMKEDLCVTDGVIMSGSRIVIPPSLRQTMLEGLHAAHQGVPAMKSRSQDSVWWPNITVDISKIRLDCDDCNKRAKSNAMLPPSDPPAPEYPFQQICSDYFHSHGKDFVVVVDRYTNWPIVFQSKGGAQGLVSNLREVFATFGSPEEITTDGGTTYTAGITQKFFEDWGVKHRLASVANPHANARAELAVKQVKRIMMDNVSSSGSLDLDAFHKAILAYRNTPCPFTKASPAMLLFGRQVRDMIPAMIGKYVPHESWANMLNHREHVLKERYVKGKEAWSEHTRKLPDLRVGDLCFIQNQTGNYPKRFDKTGRIVEVLQNDQYKLRVDGSGRITLRNRRFLRSYKPAFPNHNPAMMESPDVMPAPPQSPAPASSPLPTSPTTTKAVPRTTRSLPTPTTPSPAMPAPLKPATPARPALATPRTPRHLDPSTPAWTPQVSARRRLSVPELEIDDQTPPFSHADVPQDMFLPAADDQPLQESHLTPKPLKAHNNLGLKEETSLKTGLRSGRNIHPELQEIYDYSYFPRLPMCPMYSQYYPTCCHSYFG